jgi:hypothetical protein
MSLYFMSFRRVGSWLHDPAWPPLGSLISSGGAALSSNILIPQHKAIGATRPVVGNRF